jgi:hypothetical protein
VVPALINWTAPFLVGAAGHHGPSFRPNMQLLVEGQCYQYWYEAECVALHRSGMATDRSLGRLVGAVLILQPPDRRCVDAICRRYICRGDYLQA